MLVHERERVSGFQVVPYVKLCEAPGLCEAHPTDMTAETPETR